MLCLFPSPKSAVARHGRLYDLETTLGPTYDPAAQVDHIGMPLLRQIVTGGMGTRATMTVEHDIPILREFRDAQWKDMHREMLRIRQNALHQLICSTYIQQNRLILAAESLLQRNTIYLSNHE